MNKIKNTKSFIEKSKIIHNSFYDYSKTEYMKSCEKVIIICPIHGEFKQIAGLHLRGCGCIKCSRNKSKLNTNDFIQRSKNKHNSFYNYDKVEYKNMLTKVVITCPIHGDFLQIPNEHIRGGKCSKCAGFNRTTQEWIEKVEKIHNGKYKYDKIISDNKEFIDSNYIATIVCPIHGDFQQKACRHLIGHGCRKCGKCINTKSLDAWKKEANVIHNNKYNYEKAEYKGSGKKIKIICPTHGEFFQLAFVHIQGHGCKLCANKNNSGNLNPDREDAALRKKIRMKCSDMLKHCLRNTNRIKTDKTHKLLGYKYKELYERIITHPNWPLVCKNKWHLDHIFPVKAFLDYKLVDFKLINHLENLQPLLAKENLKKHDKYDKSKFFAWLKTKNIWIPEMEEFENHQNTIIINENE